MKNIVLGDIKIAATQYASQGNAFLGIRASGKTYGATQIAEQLLDAGIPFVAFDPIGIWRNLKVAGRGDGYKVVVAHPDHGDLPLTPESAPEIVRAAMRQNIPLVLDLYAMNLSKADWRRIVEQCVRLLLHENKDHGLRHIFLEEAAEFCPQRVGPESGRVYAEIEKLARMGGNASLGFTMINQRAEEVNKAVLELCDCLFLYRQKGRNSLTALGKWLDFADKAKSTEIIASLPTLAPGHCWVWLQGESIPVQVAMPPKKTFHPDRQHPNPGKSSASMDVSGFVGTLKESLAAHIAKAKENDPAALKKEIAELKKQIGKPAPAAAVKEKKSGEALRVAGGEIKQLRKALEAAMKFILEINTRNFEPTVPKEEIQKAVEAAVARATQMIEGQLESRKKTLTQLKAQAEKVLEQIKTIAAEKISVNLDVRHNEPFSVTPPRPARSASPTHNGELPAHLPIGEKKILAACIQHPGGLQREQLTVLTSYKRSSRDTYIQRLREKGLVDVAGDSLMATESGIAALPDCEPLPTGPELQEHYRHRLPQGELAILELLIAAYPESVNRERLSAETGYQRSSRDTYLQRLRARQLVVEHGRGEVKASEHLFS